MTFTDWLTVSWPLQTGLQYHDLYRVVFSIMTFTDWFTLSWPLQTGLHYHDLYRLVYTITTFTDWFTLSRPLQTGLHFYDLYRLVNTCSTNTDWSTLSQPWQTDSQWTVSCPFTNKVNKEQCTLTIIDRERLHLCLGFLDNKSRRPSTCRYKSAFA
jgi:hypothetical protein